MPCYGSTVSVRISDVGGAAHALAAISTFSRSTYFFQTSATDAAVASISDVVTNVGLQKLLLKPKVRPLHRLQPSLS